MKKLFLLLAFASAVAFTSCSKDEDDSDIIIGTWLSEPSTTQGDTIIPYEDQWIFKADLTGKYKEMINGEVDLESAFTWVKLEENYIVNYIEENYNDDTFTVRELLGNTTLEEDDSIIAIKK